MPGGLPPLPTRDTRRPATEGPGACYPATCTALPLGGRRGQGLPAAAPTESTDTLAPWTEGPAHARGAGDGGWEGPSGQARKLGFSGQLCLTPAWGWGQVEGFPSKDGDIYPGDRF